MVNTINKNDDEICKRKRQVNYWVYINAYYISGIKKENRNNIN